VSYLDDITLKRQAAARAKAYKYSTDTVKNGTDSVVAEIARQNARNRVSTQPVEVKNLPDLATKDNIDEVIKELKEVQLASLLSNSPKSTVILADSTDLGDRFDALCNDLMSVVNTLKSDTTMAKGFKELSSQLGVTAKAITTAVSNQKAPIVKPTDVIVQERPVDLRKLEVLLERLIEQTKPAPPEEEDDEDEDEFDITKYIAQDLDNATDGNQYIGFLNSQGKWYIVQNDGRSMRYYFGGDSYAQAWDDKYAHTYLPLSEALNA